MDFYSKKRNTLRALDKFGLGKAFQITVEEENSVLLQSEQNICNGNCLISLSLDDRLVTPIYFSLGKLINKSRKEDMLDLLNSFNFNNVILKFYLDADDCVMVQVMYINSNFDADEYVNLIGIAFQIIRDEFYSKIMRVMWA